MKRLIAMTVIYLVLLNLPIAAFAEKENDPLNTLDALNNAIVSIYRVEKLPSKVTIDEEYNNIINNIAWGNITADQELLNLFTDMMNAYTENRLEAKDRELLRQQYEAQVNRAFLEVKPLSHIKTEQALSGAKAIMSGMSGHNTVWGKLMAGAGGAAVAWGEYQVALQANERVRMQAQGQEKEFMHQRMAGEWQLDKEKIRRFNSLKTSLMNAAWPLLNKYNLPDEARITEENIDQYYNFISEKDTAKAIRIGKRLEATFSQFSQFWFYFGVFYLESGDILNARKCFEKFEKIDRPIFRKNCLEAANARYKIFTLSETEKDEARRLVNIIEKQSANDDWNNILFAALQNYQLGNKQKAEDLLIQNIDNGFNIELNREILRQVRQDKLDLNSMKSVAIRQFREPSELEKLANEGNAEAQFLLGETNFRNSRMNGVEDWLKKATDQGYFLAGARLHYIQNCRGKKDVENNKFNEFDRLSKLDSNDAQIILGDYYQNGCGVHKDYNIAISYFTPSAKNGNCYSLGSIGKMYRSQGLYEAALEVYNEAVQRECPFAKFSLGYMHEKGFGVPKNMSKAIELYTRSADEGYTSALGYLGLLYRFGAGVEKNLKKSYELYEKAANSGHAISQDVLGTMYARGEGVVQDFHKALNWYQKAADQGLPGAQYNLATMYEDGKGVAKNLQKAFDLYGKAASRGNSAAQCALGRMYRDGRGVSKDMKEAFKWFKVAADSGYLAAQLFLADCYRHGKGINKDPIKAIELFKKLAEQGNALAQLSLGTMYSRGEGVSKDLSQAIYWWQKSADQGDEVAQSNLACCYITGEGVTEDLYKAVDLYKKCADQGYAPCQNMIGMCYAKGIGVQKDMNIAHMWWRKAAEQGDKDAKYNLEASSGGSDPAAARDWYDGIAAWSRGDKTLARDLLTRACNNGSQAACKDLKTRFK